MKELWKDVPGFGGHYQASSLGRIRTKERLVEKKTRHGGVMTQKYAARLLSLINRKGYRQVRIGVDGKKLNVSVHTMVLLAFEGPKPEGFEACHRNGKPSDNRPENLRWGTHESNAADRKEHGNYANGEDHPMAKLTAEQARRIRDGAVDRRAAKESYGISESQFYRIRRGESWQEARP